MADPELENEDEKPLDPAAERLRRKMLRLVVISVGSMFIGIFAVLFAIVYKMNSTAVDPQALNAVIELPEEFVVEETRMNDGTLMMRGTDSSGSQLILLYNSTSGELNGKIELR